MLTTTEKTNDPSGQENDSQTQANAKHVGEGVAQGAVCTSDADPSRELIIDVLDYLTAEIHSTAREKGWWEHDRSDGECIVLMHAELSEAVEFLREGNPPDDKIPQFSGAEAELADTIIRILDLAGARGWNVAGAMVAKMEFNKTRPHKHGGKEW